MCTNRCYCFYTCFWCIYNSVAVADGNNLPVVCGISYRKIIIITIT